MIHVVSSDAPPPVHAAFAELEEARARVNMRKLATSDPFAKGQHVSRAYFKCRQMVANFARPHLVALLCEAPGGFYEACKERWPTAHFFVTSKQDVPFDARLPAPPSLPEGGDLRCLATVDALVEEWGRGRMDLITADGAQDCDHAIQEQANAVLLLAEVYAALLLQRGGGELLIKFFQGGTQATNDIISILQHSYRKVELIKPQASKSTNSELYLIARGFDSDRGALLAASIRKQWPASLYLRSVCSTPSPPSEAIIECAKRQTKNLHAATEKIVE